MRDLLETMTQTEGLLGWRRAYTKKRRDEDLEGETLKDLMGVSFSEDASFFDLDHRIAAARSATHVEEDLSWEDEDFGGRDQGGE